VPNYLQRILTRQFEAALCMMGQCLEACPPARWSEKIALRTFGETAYHTLFFVDYYLAPAEETFELSEFHRRGGDERVERISRGLSKPETLEMLAACRENVVRTISAESTERLAGPSGFAARKFSRGELHIYNLRHVQHHTGQLVAHLRRSDEKLQHFQELPWIGSGWK
jgi:hypothetical protein